MAAPPNQPAVNVVPRNQGKLPARLGRFSQQVAGILNSLTFQGFFSQVGSHDWTIGPGIILANGTNPFTANQSMGGHQLTDVADPTSAQDVATEHYVTTYVAAHSPVASVFGRTGAVVAASGDYTVAEVTGAAPLASPALTGVPTAPTATTGTNTTQVATCAFVLANAGGGGGGGPFPTLTPPVDADFTWINTTPPSGTVNTQNASQPHGVNLYALPINNGSTLVGRIWNTQPSTPYHVQAYLLSAFLQNNYAFGVFFMDSAGKFLVFLAQQVDPTPVIALTAYEFSNYQTPVANVGPIAVSFLAPVWMRLGDDGTNLTFDVSPDGLNWVNWYTGLRGAYLNGGTYSVGWTMYPNWNVAGGSFSNATPQSTTLVHWLQTA